MEPETRLDYAIFRLTPTRTRCELYICSGGISEKLASGLVQPFVDHLQTAAEQIAKGGYSVRLEPPDRNGTPWFSKGTMERFVRFLSTPEVLERVSAVEMELTQLEQTINAQNSSQSGGEEDLNLKVTSATSIGLERAVLSSKSRLDSTDIGENHVEENYKVRLFRALDARRVMLQKEQGMAFACATAAGFGLEQINELITFADCFGATRLREACLKFKALCKRRQEAGLCLEEADFSAFDPASAGNELHFAVMTRTSGMTTYMRPKNNSELWPDIDGKIEPNDEGNHTEKTSNMHGKVYADEAFLNTEKHHRLHNLTPEEISLILQYSVDGKGFPEELKNLETGRMGIVRAYQSLAPWQGRPQQFMQAAPHLPPGNVHPFPQNLPLNVLSHYEPPYASGGSVQGPQASLSPNSHYLGNSHFLQCTHLDSNSLSMRHTPDTCAKQVGDVHIPSTQNRPISQVYEDTLQPDNQQVPIGSVFSPHQHNVASSQIPLIDKRTDVYVSSKVPTSKLNETTCSKNTSEDDESRSSLDKDYQTPAEARRLLCRSSLPQRRSSSPMKRAQISQSAKRHSSMVVIRNINYIAPKLQDHLNKRMDGEHEDKSSGSWSEENEMAADNSENVQSTVDSLQISVQDAIGVFESSQKDRNESNKKSSKYHGQRKERSRVKYHNTSLDTHSGTSECSGNIDATSAETNCNLENYRSRNKLDAIDSEGDIDTGLSNYVHKSSTLCKSFQDDMTFLPERGQKLWNSSNIAALDFEAVSMKQPSHLNRKTVENDFLVMKTKRETVQNHILSRSAPCDDSEVCVSLRSQRCHASEEVQLFQERDRVEGRVHELSGFEMLSEQEESTFKWQFSKDFSNEQQQPTIRSPDDSFIVTECSIAREQSNTGWKTGTNIDFEMPNHGVSGKNAITTYAVDRSQEPQDMFGIAQRNIARLSRERPWNTTFDCDTQLLIEIAANNHGDNESKHETKILVKKDQKGKLYDEYKEKRDAKTRERTSNNAERKAKLKLMHEALEKRKAGMENNRKFEKPSPLVEAQLRAETLRAFKANLQKSKKEKEEEERKRLEKLISQRKERIATRSGRISVGTQSAISTPLRSKCLSSTSRPSAVSKVSPASSMKACSSANSNPRDLIQAQKSTSPKRVAVKGSHAADILQKPHKSLSHSISSLTELRKEKRNSSLRASTGSQPMTVSKSSSQGGHLESLKDPSTITNGQVEKHPTHIAAVARKTVPNTRGRMALTSKASMNLANDGSLKPHKSLRHSISSLTELRKEKRNSSLRASTGSQPMIVSRSSSQGGHLKSLKDPSTIANGQVEKHPARIAAVAGKTVSNTRGRMALTSKASMNLANDGNLKPHKLLRHSISSLTELRKEKRNSSLRASTGSQPMTVSKSSSQGSHLESLKDPFTITNGQVEKHPARIAAVAGKTVSNTRGRMALTSKVSMKLANDGNLKAQKTAGTYTAQVTKYVQKCGSQHRRKADGHVKQNMPRLFSDSILDGQVAENESSGISAEVAVAERVAQRYEAEKIGSGPGSTVGASKTCVVVVEKIRSDPVIHENLQDMGMVDHVETADSVNEAVLQHASSPSSTACNEQCVASSKDMRLPPDLKAFLHRDSDDVVIPDSATVPALFCTAGIDFSDSLHLNAPSDPSFDSTPHYAPAYVGPFASVPCPTEQFVSTDLAVCSSSIPVIYSPVRSPVPQLQQSVSPVFHNVKATGLAGSKKNREKSSSSSGSQSKEHMKGLKNLLKFRRKSSPSSGNNISDWVSAPTSKGDEDMGQKMDLGAISVERKVKSVGDRCSNFEASSDGHDHSMNYNGFGSHGAAPRSFFSLPTFRSKASDGKSR